MKVKRNQLVSIREAVNAKTVLFAEGFLSVANWNGIYTIKVLKDGAARNICKINGATKEIETLSDEKEVIRVLRLIKEEFSY